MATEQVAVHSGNGTSHWQLVRGYHDTVVKRFETLFDLRIQQQYPVPDIFYYVKNFRLIYIFFQIQEITGTYYSNKAFVLGEERLSNPTWYIMNGLEEPMLYVYITRSRQPFVAKIRDS